MAMKNNQYIKDKARIILDLYWDYQIPVDIEMIVNKMGVKINYQEYLTDKVFIILENDNGVSNHNNLVGRFDIINGLPICSIRKLNNETKDNQQIRFTLAHELGHFVLEHGGGFRDTIASFNIDIQDKREIEANAFAIEILMPKQAVDFIIQNKNITDLNELAKLFQVSANVVKHRLNQLGWI